MSAVGNVYFIYHLMFYVYVLYFATRQFKFAYEHSKNVKIL